MTREYPAFPLPGVGVIIWREAEVLLIQRGKQPNYGKWSIPGGLIELGETVTEAACREVLEECGVEIDGPELLTTIDVVLRDDDGRIRYHYLLIELTARWASGTPVAGDDAMDIRWVAMEDLPALELVAEAQGVLALAWKREQARHQPG